MTHPKLALGRIGNRGSAEQGIVSVMIMMLAAAVGGAFIGGLLQWSQHRTQPQSAIVLNAQSDVRTAMLFQSSGDSAAALHAASVSVPVISKSGSAGKLTTLLTMTPGEPKANYVEILPQAQLSSKSQLSTADSLNAVALPMGQGMPLPGSTVGP